MKKVFLLLILALGLFLRVLNLDTVPNGLTWDEAAIGYNAYSLLKTGRDEHGAFLPLIFKSFGDYKPGFYIYLTVPSVAIFGLNEFAVRLPNALFGVLSIYGLYLFVGQFLADKKNSLLPLFASFSLAISPWAVHFSRGAWEVNVFVSVLLFALYYYLKFLNRKATIFPSLFLASITLVLYQAAKMLTPLLFLLLFCVYRKQSLKKFVEIFASKKSVLLLLPFIFFGLWLVWGVIFGEAGNRLATLSIFGYKPQLANTYYENQPLLTTNLVLSRYLYHFSPEILFYEGARISERAHLPGTGLLNHLEFIPLLFGLFYLSKIFPSGATKIIFGLLLISPIPASLTLAEYSPLRALFMTIPLAIISGTGFYYLFQKLRLIYLLFLPLYLVVAVYLFDLYFVHSGAVFAGEFNAGHKEAVQIIKDNPTSKVVFTDVYGQPYIYYLFYTQFDPKTYQQESHFTSGGLDVGRVGSVGNVYFHQFGSNELENQRDVLFIGTEGNIDRTFDIAGDKVKLFKQIETPDKKIIFRAVITK